MKFRIIKAFLYSFVLILILPSCGKDDSKDVNSSSNNKDSYSDSSSSSSESNSSSNSNVSNSSSNSSLSDSTEEFKQSFYIYFEDYTWNSGNYDDKTYDLGNGKIFATKRCTIGNTEYDIANGQRALRCSPNKDYPEAFLESRFDFDGIKQVNFKYSIFGNATDLAPEVFKVQKSTDGGIFWTDVSENIPPLNKVLTNKTIMINQYGKCRIRFLINETKSTSNNRRVNIDDVEIIHK